MAQPKLEAKDFPRSLDSFLSFIGRSEVERLLKRVRMKIADTPSSLRSLFGERYFFHEALEGFVMKPNEPLDVNDLKAVRAASLIQGILHIRSNISDESQNRLCRMIHGNLQPQSDSRNLEAEVICCIHLTCKGWGVTSPDLDGEARYDCLATKTEEEVEFECKNLSVDTNPRIKPEMTISLLKVISEKLRQNTDIGSSVVALQFFKPAHLISELVRKISTAIESYPRDTSSDEFSIGFSLRPEWDNFVLKRTPEEFRSFAKSDTLLTSGNHYIKRFDPNRLIATVVLPDKEVDLVAKIQTLISDAAKQFSSTRPAVIWIHMNGIPPEEFVELARQSENDVQTALSAVAAGALFSDKINIKPFVNAVRFTVVDRNLSDRKVFTEKGLYVDAVALNGRLFDAMPHSTEYEIKSDF